MAPRSDDWQPMSQKDFKRMLETEAADVMFGWRRDRGHEIDEIRWPDREREGRKGQKLGEKTVDLIFREDGHEVGVDILELHESENHARQHAEMGRIAAQLEREIGPRLRALNPGHTIAISWDVSWLPDHKTTRAGLEVVKETILGVAADLRPGNGIELEIRPDFITRMEAHCWPSETPNFGFISSHEEETMWLGQAADSMADFLLASSKPEQLEGFSDARVLALDRALMPIPAELTAAFDDRHARIPPNWTAIYFMIPRISGSFSEVWSRSRQTHTGEPFAHED
jgi:hypothetical protein